MTDGVLSEITCTPVAGVEPIFVPVLIRGAMACRYMRCGADLTCDEALAAAFATWETEWETDPAPRTFDAAMEAVDSDLQYWGED